MVDFAVPVVVNETAVAVLLSGQRKPKPGTRWSPEFVKDGGVFQPLAEGEEGNEAWVECKRRIAATERTLGLKRGQLLARLRVKRGPLAKLEVSPTDVQGIMDNMRRAGDHLSRLAVATFQLEKAKTVAWIRGKFAYALGTLTRDKPRFGEFWDHISEALGIVTRYFGLDYALVVSFRREPSPNVVLQTYTRDGKNVPVGTEGVSLDYRQFEGLMEKGHSSPSVEPIDAAALGPAVTELRKVPILQLNLTGGVAVPIAYSQAGVTFAVLGRSSAKFSLGEFTEVNREAFKELLGSLSIVVKVADQVEELQSAAQRQASFLLDVAHDIRNPIQNIVLKAERLRSGKLKPDDIPYHAKRIATQVKRLHLLSERVWALEQFANESFKPDKVGKVQIYPVLNECRDSLLDLGTLRSVTITIDPDLQNWPALRIDKALLTQALLNLLDNAIKYSRRQSEVRVDGRDDVNARYISVVNRGVPLKPEEYDRIFNRFYRAPAAQAWILEGAGVGLSIVKKFADTYGAVSVKSQPILGTNNYVTEFVLKIEKERTEYV